MIAPKSIQEVLDAARIEEVVGDFVNLKRQGSSLTGLCPFHQEKSPSFVVTPSKNIYKCFGCGKAGDAVQFVREHEGFSFVEAIRYLAQKYRIQLEETETTAAYREEQQHLDSLFLVNQFALEFYQQQLFETDLGKSVGLGYFRQRGFREEILRKFGLGFAPHGPTALLQAANNRGYQTDLLQQVGLINQQQRDFFRDRVMFTIHSLSGKPIAFAGRIMQKDAKQPKYINSPESPIYTKSKVLYGLFFAKKMIRQVDECILVEGYTDVLSLHQAGIENVVASSGTSLTTEQIGLVKRYTNRLVLLFDGDAAGIKAAMRGLGMVLEQDLNVKVVVLPPGEDPDSYIQKVGLADFQAYLQAQAKDMVVFETELLLRDAGNDPMQRADVLVKIAQTIARVKNPLRRDEYVRATRELLQVDEGKLLGEVNRHLRQLVGKAAADPTPRAANAVEPRAIEASSPTIDPDAPVMGDAFQEKDFVRVLITGGDQWYDVEQQISVAAYLLAYAEDLLPFFDYPLYREVVEVAQLALLQGRPIHPNLFTQHPEEKIRQLAFNFLSNRHEMSENWEKRFDIRLNQLPPEANFRADAEEAAKHLRVKKYNRLILQNQMKIKELAGDHPELMLLLKLDQKLKIERNQLAQELGIIILG